MKRGEIAKFCAGATIDTRNLESISPSAEIATTGTLEAFLAKPVGDEWVEFDLWFGFGLMVFCFAVVVIEDKIGGA